MEAFMVGLNERESRETLCKFHSDRYDNQAVLNILEGLVRLKLLFKKYKNQ